jgi:RHS repeat-associated protein
MQQVAIDSFDAAGVKTRTERTTFDYGDAGWRVSTLQEVDADADGTFETRTRTEFLADKSNFTGYAQTLQEVVTNADTGAEIKRTVYTIGLDVVAQTVFTPGGPSEGETHVFLYDGHGSVRMLADLLAAVVESYNFDAYGNPHGFDPAAALTSLLYSGEHFNAAIGQQYLRARWYDAMTGRFNRLDPFAGNVQDAQSLQKYLYTLGDPVNAGDPSGESSLISVTVSIGVVGALFGGIGGALAGYRRGGLKGAIIGGIVGTLVGALVGAAFGASAWALAHSFARQGNIFFELTIGHRKSTYWFIGGAIMGAIMGTFLPEYGLAGLMFVAAGLVPTPGLFKLNNRLRALAKAGKLAPWLTRWYTQALGGFTLRNGKPLTMYHFLRTSQVYFAHFAAGYALGYLAGVTTRFAVDAVLDAADNA